MGDGAKRTRTGTARKICDYERFFTVRLAKHHEGSAIVTVDMSALLLAIVAAALPQQQLSFSDSSLLPSGSAPALSFPHYEPVLRLNNGFHLATPSSIQQRPKAVELSDGYYTRLKIHKYTSYAMVPLFIAQYAVGRKLYNDTGENESLRALHSTLAAGIYVGFGINTVTGAWNLWETRAQPEGRTRRYVHAILMTAAAAGFVATSAMAPDDDEGGGSSSGASAHRNMAIASMSTAVVGGLMMVFWK